MKNFSWSSVAAGFVTVLVGITSSAVIVLHAASTAGATPQQANSWIFALCVGTGLTCIGLSLRYRIPVVTAWSTPGAALLVTSLSGISMPEAIGAFMFSAVLIILCGITGWFERVIGRIPLPLAAAMLAGIVMDFGMNVFIAMQSQFVMVFTMFVVWLLLKCWIPRYAVIMVLLTGIMLASRQGLLHFNTFHFSLAKPVFTMPSFSWAAIIGVGIPLFIVTMVSQNAPGVAAIKASGYDAPISSLVSWTGLTMLLLAPFGCFSLNLAAITAAICMGKEAHADPAKRYWAAVAAGIFYLLVGICGATVTVLFATFPQELVLAIAGLALFGTIASNLAAAMSMGSQREAALVTFLVTASGMSLFGIGSAFWGLIAGGMAFFIFNRWDKRYS